MAGCVCACGWRLIWIITIMLLLPWLAKSLLLPCLLPATGCLHPTTATCLLCLQSIIQLHHAVGSGCLWRWLLMMKCVVVVVVVSHTSSPHSSPPRLLQHLSSKILTLHCHCRRRRRCCHCYCHRHCCRSRHCHW